MINYFFCYSYTDSDGRSGCGNVDMSCSKAITDIQRVREIEAAIDKTHFNSGATIVVTSWQRFEKEPAVADVSTLK